MPQPSCTVRFRVRYADTDQMGTYYNSRALEWFEVGRSELLRALGRPYRQWEGLGLRTPVREAHVRFLGTASYDDELVLRTTLSRSGRARVRFDCEVRQSTGEPVCQGWTEHVVTDSKGRPLRPPDWLLELTEDR